MKCGLFYSKYDWHLEIKLTRDLKNRHFALLTDEYYSRPKDCEFYVYLRSLFSVVIIQKVCLT